MWRILPPVRLVIAMGALGVTLVDAAPAPQARALNYGIRSWQTDDGLPRNSVQAIAQTPDGYLWVGTQRGLVRFDGVRFTPVAGPSAFLEALQTDAVRALLVSRQGHLWIGLDGSGLWERRTDGTVRAHQLPGDDTNYVRALIETRDGTIWAGTGTGLFRCGPTGWSRIGTTGHALSVFILREDRAGRLWAGTEQGLAVLNASRTASSIVAGTSTLGIVSGLAEDPVGGLWVGASAGLWRVEQVDGPPRVESTGFRERVRTLHVDHQGILWLGTDRGVLQHHDDGPPTWPVNAATVGATTFCIGNDREHNVWVGTNAGLYRLRGGQFTEFGPAQGLPHGVALAVLEDHAGAMWIGTWGGGVVRSAGGTVATFTTADGLPNNRVFSLLEDRHEVLWVGTDAGLARFTGRRFETLSPPGLEPARVHVVAEDRRGAVWVGTPRGLFRVTRGGAVPVVLPGVVQRTSVRAVVEDDRGVVWVAGGHSLYRLDEPDRVTASLAFTAGSPINALLVDGTGILWLGTRSSGLIRYDGKRPFAFAAPQGLVAEEILAIAADGADRLWLSTKRGILRVARADLEAVSTGQARELAAASYGARDGMTSTEGTGESAPGVWRGRDGRLWFPTTRGMVVVSPSDLEPNRVPPTVILEQVLYDGSPVSDPEHGLGPTNEVRLPPGRGNLEFRYTAPSFVAPERVRFRHKLEGFDPDWVEAADRRVAIYTNVPPGPYRFRVVARNDEGVWTEAGADVRLRVEQRFIQTPLFAGLGAGVLAMGIWAAHRVRMRQLTARLAAVKAERNRMAREIHDTLLQGVAGIGFQLEAVRHRLRHDAAGAEEILDRVAAHVDSCLGEARRSVRNMRSAWLDGQPLAAALAESGRLLVSGDTRLDVRVEHWPDTLDRHVEAQIFRIAQEAITNAIAHSGSPHIDVVLTATARHLRVEIADRGRGFEGHPVPDGRPRYGLVGMRERARQLGARLVVHSAPGTGTRVVLVVPLTWWSHLRRVWMRRHSALEGPTRGVPA